MFTDQSKERVSVLCFDYVILNEKGEVSNCRELCLIGDQLTLGYYNDEERTN